MVASDSSGTKRERWLPDPMVTRAEKGRKISTPASNFYCWDYEQFKEAPQSLTT